MARTTVAVDEELLHAAARVLGTAGVSSTVNAALAAAVRHAALADFDVRVFDITDEQVEGARAERL